MNFLQQRYVTVAALNLAWGSNYSVFGSNGGWGVGTGLLDEDGANPWVPKDSNSLSDASATVKKDLDDFLLVHAQKYFSDVRAVLNTRAPGRLYLGPTTLGSWGAPPRRQVLRAAAGSIDIFMAATIPAGVLDDQQRIEFIAQYLGDKPWIEWEGFVANPDSYMSPLPGRGHRPSTALHASPARLGLHEHGQLSPEFPHHGRCLPDRRLQVVAVRCKPGRAVELGAGDSPGRRVRQPGGADRSGDRRLGFPDRRGGGQLRQLLRRRPERQPLDFPDAAFEDLGTPARGLSFRHAKSRGNIPKTLSRCSGLLSP